jgi:plastocyanin domain-containing protein
MKERVAMLAAMLAAMLVLSAGLAALVPLAGCGAPAGPKEIHVTVTDAGFVPEVVSFPRGRPAVLIIKRIVEATCATDVIFTETGRKYDLPLNEEVRIDIPTDQAVTFHYACGMNMYHGEVAVK